MLDGELGWLCSLLVCPWHSTLSMENTPRARTSSSSAALVDFNATQSGRDESRLTNGSRPPEDEISPECFYSSDNR